MPAGVHIEVADGQARVEFTVPAGPWVTRMVAAGPVAKDTSGPRHAYLIPETSLEKAGLVDTPKRKPGRPRKNAPSDSDMVAGSPARERDTTT